MRPCAKTIIEKAFHGPRSGDVTKVQKILDDPKMPATAEKGMAYVVHWADGRGIFALKKKADLKPWLEKQGEMAEIVSIKYGKAEHKGKPLRITENVIVETIKLKSFNEYAKLVSKAYTDAPAMDPKAVPAWKALIAHIETLYKRLTGVVKMEWVDDDPYPNVATMQKEVKATKLLKIWKGGTGHPTWSHGENLHFRAVHDYYSHIIAGQPFGVVGEIKAYNTHAKMCPPAALPALFTEIVGQACTAVVTGGFPEQKIALLPGFDYVHLGRVEGHDIVKKELVPQEKVSAMTEDEAAKTDVTQTPAFKTWFMKSKVVDKNGKPLRVYHGTDKDFNEFAVAHDFGYHFGTSQSANHRLGGMEGEPTRLLPVYLRINSPLRLDFDPGWNDANKTVDNLYEHKVINDAEYARLNDIIEKGQADDWKTLLEKYLRRKAYDGVIYKNDTEDAGSFSYLVFNPNQIKSATGNRGTFDRLSPKLTESVAESYSTRAILESVFTSRDLDLDKTYGVFKGSYEKQTGKAWDKDKFLERIGNWTLYGDHDGFVATRTQASGPIKLVGAAGNPIGVKKGFQEVLATNKPVWGAMDLRLATMAARMGMKMPPAWLMVKILNATKDKFAMASGLDPGAVQVNKDGSLTLDYPDIGKATKFIVGNGAYFKWLLATQGSAIPAVLRTAISYFVTTGKPPPMPKEEDQEANFDLHHAQAQ